MKLLVTGGRKYKNRPQLWRHLDQIHKETPIEILIHGDAEGADTMADEWAKERGVQRVVCPACWGHYDSSIAGHRRNRFMLELLPNRVVAFPGGAGTGNMVAQAHHKKVPVLDLRKLI